MLRTGFSRKDELSLWRKSRIQQRPLPAVTSDCSFFRELATRDMVGIKIYCAAKAVIEINRIRAAVTSSSGLF